MSSIKTNNNFFRFRISWLYPRLLSLCRGGQNWTASTCTSNLFPKNFLGRKITSFLVILKLAGRSLAVEFAAGGREVSVQLWAPRKNKTKWGVTKTPLLVSWLWVRFGYTINKEDRSHHCAASITNHLRPRIIRICPNPNCRKKFYGDTKYCSSSCVPKTPIKYSNEFLIRKIQRFYKKYKRIPLKREFNSNWQAYYRSFGSWNKAIQETGFTPNLERFTHKYVAKDGHVCDSLSEKIIDNWLSLNNLLHEHGVYYPGQKKFKTDFLVKSKYWIEFPGLLGQLKHYDKLYLKKMKLVKKLGIKIVEVLPTDIFPKNTLAQKLAFLLE